MNSLDHSRWPHRTARSASLVAGALGVGTLLGWTFDVGLLRTTMPGWPAMPPLAAVCLLLSAAALWLVAPVRAPVRGAATDSPQRIRLGRIFATLPALVGLLRLAEYLAGRDPTWHLLGFSPAVESVAGETSTAMSPVAGLVFLLAGSALWLMARSRRVLVAQLIAIPVLPLVWLGFSRFVFGGDAIAPFFALAGSTALGAVVLLVGILCLRPDEGLVRWWRAEHPDESVPRSDNAAAFTPSRNTVGLFAGFALALTLIAGVAWLNTRAQARALESVRSVAHAQDVRLALRTLLSDAQDVQTGMRGYVLSGSPTFLEPYDAGRLAMPSSVRKLRTLTADDAEQQSALDSVEILVARLVDFSDRVVRARRAARAEAAQAMVASGEGKAAMDAVRAAVAQMDAREVELLTERQQRAGRDATNSFQATANGTLLAIVLLVAVFALMRRESQRRRSAESAVRDLNTTLEQRVRERTHELDLERGRLAAAFAASEVGFVMSNSQGGGMSMNPSAYRFMGFANATDMHKRVGEYANDMVLRDCSGNILPFADWPLPRAIRGDYCRALDLHLHNLKSGHEWYGSFTAVPVRSSAGAVHSILLSIVEITARKRADDALRTLNADLEQRVLERTAALAAAMADLESFSYSVSHDLRAPLRHIHGYVEMLRSATAGQLAEEPARHLSTISEASQEMGRLIDDLLAFSRLGRAELTARPVAMDTLVQQCLGGMELALRGRNIDWRIAPLPTIIGDESMLRQVLANLLGNAVKYTAGRAPARIDLELCGEENGRLVFVVRDNGAGFDMQYAGKLFQVFQRLHSVDEFEGTGVGLATVRRVIARHGGRTWAEGKLGEGASFYFTLEPAGTSIDRLEPPYSQPASP